MSSFKVKLVSVSLPAEIPMRGPGVSGWLSLIVATSNAGAAGVCATSSPTPAQADATRMRQKYGVKRDIFLDCYTRGGKGQLSIGGLSGLVPK